MADEKKETTAHGYHLDYDNDTYRGMDHLKRDLDKNEARVFFDQARRRGSAQFEDDSDRQFTLTYKDGKYNVTRR